MGANRIIAFKENDDTFYVKDVRGSYDKDNKTKVVIVDKTDKFAKGTLYTKSGVGTILKKLKLAGFDGVVIKPFETSNYYKLSISIITPDRSFSYYDSDSLSLNFKIWSETKSFNSKIEYTHPNTVLNNVSLNNSLKSFNFETKDGAKHFIELNKDLIFERVKNSLTLVIH